MTVFVLWLGSGTETTGLALGKHFLLAENSCVAVLKIPSGVTLTNVET